jgi:hypothetical protein
MNRERSTNFIKLPDVFNLIYSSKMPFAEEFKNWISYELLPSIYMNGTYTDQNHDPNFQMNNPIYEIDKVKDTFTDNTQYYPFTTMMDINGNSYDIDNLNQLYNIGKLLNDIFIPSVISNQQKIMNAICGMNIRIDNLENQLNKSVNEIKQLIVPATIEPKE